MAFNPAGRGLHFQCPRRRGKRARATRRLRLSKQRMSMKPCCGSRRRLPLPLLSRCACEFSTVVPPSQRMYADPPRRFGVCRNVIRCKREAGLATLRVGSFLLSNHAPTSNTTSRQGRTDGCSVYERRTRKGKEQRRRTEQKRAVSKPAAR